MTDAEVAISLALADGRALLTVGPCDLGTAVVERVQVEWPEWPGLAALPADGLSHGLRRRRGRLRAASLLVEGARLDRRLAETPVAADGISRLALTLDKGRVMVNGHVAAGGRDAEFKARLVLGPGEGRTLRVAIEDVRVQGAPPLPLAAIGAAVIAIVARELSGTTSADGSAVDVDPLQPALDEVLVGQGWRLPASRDLRLGSVAVSARGIELGWGAEDELSALRAAVDAAAPGHERAELAHQLAAAYERAHDEEAALAALRVCIDNAGPGQTVATAWRRLVELHARRGDPAAAARALIASADDTRTGASDEERAAALVAAAGILSKRLSLPADAGMLLERALALAPTSIEALEALELLSTETGDFDRLADVLERRLQMGARGPVEQKEIAERLAAIYEGPLGRHDRARELRAKLAPDVEQAAAPAPPPAPPPAAPAPPAAPDERPDGEHDLAAAHAADGETAEAGGDLESAEQAYWRAATNEAQPGLRANYLVSHARVLLARGDMKSARAQLETARARAPGHVGATALLADVCYRTQDWTRARELYTLLDTAPDAADVLPRELLVQRRAALADRQGDTPEAEALYRELAILNPQHAGARKALAELARARGDLESAVQRLEEVLRLLPSDAAGDLLDIRQRLGAVYAEMQQWEPARHYLELVLAQDPGRAPALELLLEAYDKLDFPEAAAHVCGRLGRLYFEPGRRAAALFRQAEILRTRLDNPAAALDAYLRSSDLDPHFVPARLRLVQHFWSVGDLDVVADIANDLAEHPLSPESEPDLVVRLVIASTTLRGGAEPRFSFAGPAALAPAAARAVAEVAAHFERDASRGVDALDSMLTRVRIWAGADGEAALYEVLIAMVLEDPGQPGAATALGRLAELSGRLALAGAAYGMAAFVAPEGPAARQIPALASPGHVLPDAVRIGGPADHPDIALPARRALAQLATALLGFGTDASAPKPKAKEGSGLPPTRATELRRIADLIAAPPFIVVRDSGEHTAADERRRLRVIPTQPAGLMIAASAAALTEGAWSFVAGRALETLRSGLRTAGLAGVEGLARLLEGARAVLADVTVDEPHASAVADWLRRPGSALSLMSAETRAEIRADVDAALAALPDWATFVRGAQHTRNRIGLLSCPRPSDALAVLKGEIRGHDVDTPDARRAFLRGGVAAELVKFMLSPAYEAAFAPDPEERP
jgi:tetratricopeptide (TPR) repeat protein